MIGRRPLLLVIGLGRPGCGDDAVGLIAAERLGPLAPPAASVARHQGEMTALIDLWGEHEAVFLIDATDLGADPGTLSRYEGAALPIPTRHLSAAPREARSATPLELARALGRLPPMLTVFGIEGASFAPDSPPSDRLLEALPMIVERLLGEIIALTAAIPRKLKG